MFILKLLVKRKCLPAVTKTVKCNCQVKIATVVVITTHQQNIYDGYYYAVIMPS